MEADFGLTQFAFEQSERNGFEQDSKLIVNFTMKPHLDKTLSLKEGRPIYTSKEYVTIIVPGDKTNIVNRPVWDQDRRRFPRQYAAFKNNQEQQLTGTPLETVPWISREQVEEMKHFNIRTLENLADCPDVHAQKFMGINKLRQRARDHIQAAKDSAPQAALRAEVEKRDAQLKEQNELIARLEARLAKLEEEEDED